MFNRFRVASLTGVTALACLAVTACGANGSGSGDTSTVKFSGLEDPAPIPALVMQEEGIDKKHGFEAEFEAMDASVSETNFLMGESDIAVDLNYEEAAIARNQGHDIVSFYPTLTNTASVVVPKDSEFKDPKDLIEKKVGHFGVDSGTTQSTALVMEEFYSVNPLKDYELIENGPPALPELLTKGEVDAIFDFEPFPIRAINATPGRYLLQVAKTWQKEWDWTPPIAMLTAKDEWLHDNPDLAKKVVEAWQEATQKIIDSDYEIFKKDPYKSFLNLKDDKELEDLVDYCVDLPCYTNEWDGEDVDKANKYLELMAKHKSTLKKVPEEPATVVLDDFLSK